MPPFVSMTLPRPDRAQSCMPALAALVLLDGAAVHNHRMSCHDSRVAGAAPCRRPRPLHGPPRLRTRLRGDRDPRASRLLQAETRISRRPRNDTWASHDRGHTSPRIRRRPARRTPRGRAQSSNHGESRARNNRPTRRSSRTDGIPSGRPSEPPRARAKAALAAARRSGTLARCLASLLVGASRRSWWR